MVAGNIPVNSLSRHIDPLREQLAEACRAVIDSGYFVLGPSVQKFESAFAEYCGAGHCIGVANGTDALELSLKALGVSEADCVFVTANAAMYGTSAVLACGAEPVFVDVTREHGTMDARHLEALVKSGVKGKAIIVTHLYGKLANVGEILRIAREHDIRVVEDCAQSHGAQLEDGCRAGSLGDIASFSFYPTKNLGALGDGGAVVTNSDVLALRVRQLRQYGWTQKYTNGLSGGRNSRLDEIQAAMLEVMLPLVDGWNARRREIANSYSAGIKHDAIRTTAECGDDCVAHLYVIHTDRRDDLRQHLQSHGIQTEIHYPRPDHRQPCHGGRYDSISLPITEELANTALTLPCFPELTDEEVRRVIDVCNQF